MFNYACTARRRITEEAMGQDGILQSYIYLFCFLSETWYGAVKMTMEEKLY